LQYQEQLKTLEVLRWSPVAVLTLSHFNVKMLIWELRFIADK
jgi:hypothetical protein